MPPPSSTQFTPRISIPFTLAIYKQIREPYDADELEDIIIPKGAPLPSSRWLREVGIRLHDIKERHTTRLNAREFLKRGRIYQFPEHGKYMQVPWLITTTGKRGRTPSPTPTRGRSPTRSRLNSPERPDIPMASQVSDMLGSLPSTINTADMETPSPEGTPKASRVNSPTPALPSQISTADWSESDNGLPGYRKEGWGIYNQLAYSIKTAASKDAKSQYGEVGNIAAISLFGHILDNVAIIIKGEEFTTDSVEYSQLRHHLARLANDFAKDIKPLSLEDTDVFASHKPLSPESSQPKQNDRIMAMLESINSRLDNIEGRNQTHVGSYQSMHAPSIGPFADPAPFVTPPRATPAPQSQPSPPVPFAPVPQNPAPQPRANTNTRPHGNAPQSNNVPKPKTLPKVDQVRFVIRCNKSSVGPTTLTNRTIIDKVNMVISKASNNPPRAIGASWNRSNNIILVFPSSLNPDLITPHIADILQTLGLPSDTIMSRDVAWSKIMITHVLTGLVVDGDEVFSDESVANNFIGDNEWASALKFTMRPRWLLKPDTIKKSMSSVVLAFEDPDGTIAREFLRKPVWMFGNSCRSKRWEDKPILQQCDKCQQLGHIASACKRKDACGVCAGSHNTFNHNVACKSCRDANILVSEPCPHPFKCVNCQGPHMANDSSCPRRSKFRAPREPSVIPSSQPAADGMETE